MVCKGSDFFLATQHIAHFCSLPKKINLALNFSLNAKQLLSMDVKLFVQSIITTPTNASLHNTKFLRIFLRMGAYHGYIHT